jgi:hypothetical protein
VPRDSGLTPLLSRKSIRLRSKLSVGYTGPRITEFHLNLSAAAKIKYADTTSPFDVHFIHSEQIINDNIESNY